MRSIKCQNERVGYKGKTSCNYELLSLPEWILTQLKLMEGDPEGKIVVHCHWCRGTRWAEIKYENGKLVFKSLKERPLLGEPAMFEDLSITSQSGLVEA